jgi:hypothetical protein
MPAGLLPAPAAGHGRCHQHPSWLDPDRASFTVALNTARDQLIQAAGVIASTTIDLAGKIGRAVLNNLLADRRLRVSPRVVKRAISKYNPEGPPSTRPATRQP